MNAQKKPGAGDIMRRIKNNDLAQLLLQLKFTPPDKRRAQLEAAESLFDIIEPQKEYPFEFIHYRIVGFHSKNEPDQPIVIGDEILQDLSIFISTLSSGLAEPVNPEKEEIYTIQELAERFDVSIRTIQRWRKRGLIARKFLFPDGRKRLACRPDAIEKFAAENPGLIDSARSFERLTPADKRKIIRKLSRLASKSGMSRRNAIKNVAEQTHKAHETIRYVLKQHETADPKNRIFSKPPGVMDAADESDLYRLYKQNVPVKELMARFDRSRSSIYRIVNRRRAKALFSRKIEYIQSDEFLREDAQRRILGPALPELRNDHTPAKSAPAGPPSIAADSLPKYIQTLKNAPTLNRETEMALFRRYNFLKFLAARKRSALKITNPSSTAIYEIEDHLAWADRIKRHLTEANLRLVVGIARKHTSNATNMVDLVSEGNLSLVRAIEKFDYTKGFRFATYASWTIAKEFARKIPAETTRPDRASGASLDRIGRDLSAPEATDIAAMERASHSLVQVIKNELDEREQYVILNRFGPIGQPITKKTKSLKEVGDNLGLTKERVRQLELTALQKLRQSLSSEEFELLTGLP